MTSLVPRPHPLLVTPTPTLLDKQLTEKDERGIRGNGASRVWLRETTVRLGQFLPPAHNDVEVRSDKGLGWEGANLKLTLAVVARCASCLWRSPLSCDDCG